MLAVSATITVNVEQVHVLPLPFQARACREAGATVRFNTMLRDMNINVSANDQRSIEVLASGLPLHHGAQVTVDITLRCALRGCSNAHLHTATTNGAVLARARVDKERKYVELLDAKRCRLVVIAVETGGRWSNEALASVDSLASACAPPVMRRSSRLSWRRRWCRMLSVSCFRAFAASLVALPATALPGTDGATPDLADLFTE